MAKNLYFGISNHISIKASTPEKTLLFFFVCRRLKSAFAFLFVDFFDTAGTLTSVANLTGKVNKNGEVEGIDKALTGLSRRTKFVSKMESAAFELKENFSQYQEDFNSFFPELLAEINCVRNQL